MDDEGRISTHFWLTQGMARSIGVNVNEALRKGRLDRGAYAELVARCCHCARTSDCMGWMARQGAGAEALPLWCAVKPAIEALKEPAC